MAVQETHPIKIFYYCAQEDEPFRELLKEHLIPQKKNREITFMPAVQPGEKWQVVEEKHIENADIILVFLSANFMFTRYYDDTAAMTRTLERQKAGTARVIPILLKPVDWKATPFGSYAPLPRNGQPVTAWVDRDAALLDITLGIKEVVKQMRSKQLLPPADGAISSSDGPGHLSGHYIRSKHLPSEPLREGRYGQVYRKRNPVPVTGTGNSLNLQRSPLQKRSLINTASPLTMVQQSKAPNYRAEQRWQALEHLLPRRQLRVTAIRNGIISLVIILMIIGIAFLRGWNITWLYFMLTVCIYIPFLLYSFLIERWLLDKDTLCVHIIGIFKIEQSNMIQIRISTYLALILLVVGFWLTPANFFAQIVIFAGAVIVGGSLPFFVLRPDSPDSTQTSAGIIPPVLAHLIVVDSGPSEIAPGTTFNLHQKTTIGRGPTNTIQISELFLSVEHTRMWSINGGTWYVQDAGSTMGTFLNNQPARDALLARKGDIIQVGLIRFKLVQ